MNPLSALTFYQRHKRRTVLLLALIGLATAGLYLMVALSWAIFVEPTRANHLLLSRFSVVTTSIYGDDDGPAVIAHIRNNPNVERAIRASRIQIWLPHATGGETSSFFLLGLAQEDIPTILERCGATLQEGQLPGPRTNGIVLSAQVAANLGLQVGDTMHNASDPRQLYSNIVDPLHVVGILQGDVSLGIVSLEYLESHELYRTWPTSVLVAAREGREADVDAFLEEEIVTRQTWVSTYSGLVEAMARERQAASRLFVPIIATVSAATTLVVSAVNRIEFAERLPEFGILHATGHGKRWLRHRVTIETAALAAVGWTLGAGLSWLVLYALKLSLFVPRGHDLAVITLAPILLTTPVPIAVTGFTYLGAGRVFARLDPVAVVERRELSLEQNRHRQESKSSPRALSSWTFYRRHARRAVLIIGAMTLMIMAVALVIFMLGATHDAQQASLGYLQRMSRAYPRPGSRLHPGIVSQIRAHPAVERVIPVGPRYGMLTIRIPPFGTSENASPYAVPAEDMAYLVELYGLELKEGHLPRPHSNEMVIAEALAQNRGLEVGDIVGDRDHPAYPGASPLPATFVISGIFARAPQDENWLGFVSLEFMERHEGFGISTATVSSLIVVPKPGQEAALDDWLESGLATDDVFVLTYRQEKTRLEERTRSLMLTMALIESLIALVAAISLAVLNHIFVTQRQIEFGLLHALGHGRWRLVWRTLREAAFTTGAAWWLSVTLCLAGLLGLRFGVFIPLGLRLNLLNLAPWLFTLPIPFAVLIASGGTSARMLASLDPITAIEKRQA
jgi:ABC-type lipoprotein release transport system permease subunit